MFQAKMKEIYHDIHNSLGNKKVPECFLVDIDFKDKSFIIVSLKWLSNFINKVAGFTIQIPSPGVPCSKQLGGSKVDSAFHRSEVDKMITRNFWELNGKK